MAAVGGRRAPASRDNPCPLLLRVTGHTYHIIQVADVGLGWLAGCRHTPAGGEVAAAIAACRFSPDLARDDCRPSLRLSMPRHPVVAWALPVKRIVPTAAVERTGEGAKRREWWRVPAKGKFADIVYSRLDALRQRVGCSSNPKGLEEARIG